MSDATALRSDQYAPPAELARPRTLSLWVGVAGSAVALLGLFVDRGHFYQAYLVAFLFWLCVALGCFGLAMLHHLTRGGWGLMIRRPLEAASRTVPLLLVLFVPLVFGMHDLYHWTHTELLADDPILRQKAEYLNVGFWLLRAALYFGLWLLWVWRLNALSREQDRTGDPALFRRLQAWSATGFLMLALTLTFASVDWLMSLDPHWFSSLFGLWFLAAAALSGLSFVIVVAHWLSVREPLAGTLRPLHFHDYGKLLLAFTMLWAYLSFSQFLLIWSANLPEEITFYVHRLRGGWGTVSVVLLLGQFVLPFLLLLSAGLKRRSTVLVQVALWVLLMRWVDLYWNTAPTLQALHGEEHLSLAGVWIDLAAVVGIGGLWLAVFLWQLGTRPLLPVRDPYLAEALARD